MTETQLYLAIGIPTLAVLVGMLVNASQFAGMNGRLSSIESRMTALANRFEARMSSLESRLEARIATLEGKFEILVGKVIDIDNRMTRLEERLDH